MPQTNSDTEQALSGYLVLIRQFVDGRISAENFESAFLSRLRTRQRICPTRPSMSSTGCSETSTTTSRTPSFARKPVVWTTSNCGFVPGTPTTSSARCRRR